MSSADPTPSGLADPAVDFFSTPALEQRLDLLAHLIEFGQPPIVLTGPLGAGKTTLINELLARAPEHWRIALLTADAGTVDLAAGLLAAWGLDVPQAEPARVLPEDPSDLFPGPVSLSASAVVQEQVSRWVREEHIPLVVLDDAERIPTDALAQALAWLGAGADHRGLRLLLVGEPGLELKLRQPPLRAALPGLVHSLEMPALQPSEINDYLLARQRAAGLAAVRLPEAAAVRLHSETGGLPGLVYERFVRAVAAVAAHEAEPARRVPALPRLGEPTTRRYALAMGLVALSFVSSLVWRALPERAPPTLPSVLETLTLPPSEHAALEPPTVAVTHLPIEARDESVPDPGPTVTDTPTEPEPIRAAADSPLPPAEPAATPSVAESAPMQAIPPVPVPVTPEVVEAVPPVEVPAPAPPPKAAAGSDRRWLQDQAAEAYTLQLLASEDGAKARAALKTLGLGKDGHLVKLSRKGRSLYVVLYGSFADRAAAQAAAARLPAAARAAKPFPKTFKSLQAELGGG